MPVLTGRNPASSQCFADRNIWGQTLERYLQIIKLFLPFTKFTHSVVVISFSSSEGQPDAWSAERRGVRRGSDKRSEFHADVKFERVEVGFELRVNSEKCAEMNIE